jgi:Domain of unknown function (DUF1906)
MSTLLVDYSWTHPSPAGIRAAGYSGVVRYLSPDPTKNLTPAERDALFAFGLSITLVWESTGSRAGKGQAAGAVDAHEAEKQASTLGYPGGCPLFYADDSGQLSAAAVTPYFDGVESATTYPVGVYGCLSVIEGISVPWKWQTSAWSGVDKNGNGLVSAQAHLYQRQRPTVARPLGGTDENIVLHPFPMWTATPAPPVKKPVKPPVAYPKPTSNVPQVKAIQAAVHVTTDGKFGTVTLAAVNAVIRKDTSNVRFLQARVGAVADGVWGPISEAAWLTTICRIQSAIGVAADGDWGPRSSAAWIHVLANDFHQY